MHQIAGIDNIRLHQAYADACRKGQEASKPGATAADVFAAAEKAFEEAGYTVGPRRSFGHGMGVDLHEPPRISPDDHTKLQRGMVFTVEVGGIASPEGIQFSKSQATIVTSGAPEKLPPYAEEIIVA